MGVFAGTATFGLVAGYSTPADLESPNALVNIAFAETYTNGTGSNQANVFWSDTRTLVAAAETLNLASGSLTDRFGTVLGLTKVKGIFVRNKATTTGYALSITGTFVQGVAILATAPMQNIAPGGILVKTSPIDGITVSHPGNSELIISSGANTITYDLVIWGTM